MDRECYDDACVGYDGDYDDGDDNDDDDDKGDGDDNDDGLSYNYVNVGYDDYGDGDGGG